jgi:limonene-1,2-epoxide hydrolase
MARARPVAGREAIAAMLRSVFYDTFSDVEVTLHRAAADSAQGIGLIECTFRGRHTGTLLGIEPTFRQVELPMLAIYEVERGEIRRARQYYDIATLLRQLGQEHEASC